MLVFAGRADNWFDLYKALEMARTIAGGKERLLALLDGSLCEAFDAAWRTANFHRHARSDSLPGKPPSFREARVAMADVVKVVLHLRMPPVGR